MKCAWCNVPGATVEMTLERNTGERLVCRVHRECKEPVLAYIIKVQQERFGFTPAVKDSTVS